VYMIAGVIVAVDLVVARTLRWMSRFAVVVVVSQSRGHHRRGIRGRRSGSWAADRIQTDLNWHSKVRYPGPPEKRTERSLET